MISEEEKATRRDRVAKAKDALARSVGAKGEQVAPARAALKTYLQRLNEPKQPDDAQFEVLIEAPFKAPPKKKTQRPSLLRSRQSSPITCATASNTLPTRRRMRWQCVSVARRDDEALAEAGDVDPLAATRRRGVDRQGVFRRRRMDDHAGSAVLADAPPGADGRADGRARCAQRARSCWRRRT